ncbi:UNVERIFIED_CONTAM: hypothetical protein NY100_33865 [Prevotella sp. 15_C9]
MKSLSEFASLILTLVGMLGKNCVVLLLFERDIQVMDVALKE